MPGSSYTFDLAHLLKQDSCRDVALHRPYPFLSFSPIIWRLGITIPVSVSPGKESRWLIRRAFVCVQMARQSSLCEESRFMSHPVIFFFKFQKQSFENRGACIQFSVRTVGHQDSGRRLKTSSVEFRSYLRLDQQVEADLPCLLFCKSSFTRCRPSCSSCVSLAPFLVQQYY